MIQIFGNDNLGGSAAGAPEISHQVGLPVVFLGLVGAYDEKQGRTGRVGLLHR